MGLKQEIHKFTNVCFIISHAFNSLNSHHTVSLGQLIRNRKQDILSYRLYCIFKAMKSFLEIWRTTFFMKVSYLGNQENSIN